MVRSNVKEIVSIAQEFEDEIRNQKITNFDESIKFPAKHIYLLLCNLMPNPKDLVWGDPNFKVPGPSDG